MQLFLRILRMIYYQVLFFFLSFLWGYTPPQHNFKEFQVIGFHLLLLKKQKLSCVVQNQTC